MDGAGEEGRFLLYEANRAPIKPWVDMFKRLIRYADNASRWVVEPFKHGYDG